MFGEQRSFAQVSGGDLVGRQERLKMQFRQGDVGSGSERGQGGDQPQFTAVGAQSERHSEADIPWAEIGRWQISLQFGDELVGLRVRTDKSTVAHRLGDVAAPLRQVDHPAAEAVRVQGEAAHVHRRLQQFRCAALGEEVESGISVDEVAVLARDQGGIGHMTAKHAPER